MKKICIFTYSFMHRHHTMVNYHIENLFGGNSCVCCRNRTDFQTVERSVLERSEIKRGYLDPLHGMIKKYRNKLNGLPSFSIYGAERAHIIDFLKSEHVDVVLCEFGDIGADVAYALGDIDIPIYTYFRGYDGTMRMRSARQRKLVAAAFRNMKGVFFVSEYLRESLSAYGINHPNSHVIPSGVSTDKFFPGTKIKGKFIAVGRLIEKKRPDLTVEAFCHEAKYYPEATLDVLGGGQMFDVCQEIVRREGMERKVKLLGEQPHEVVLQHLRSAQYFLQHSATSAAGDAEGAPTSIQEAMACGCVVVATRHAGIPWLIEDGKTGFLVNELDVVGYRHLIRSALEGELDADRTGTAARDFATANLDNRVLIKRLESALKFE